MSLTWFVKLPEVKEKIQQSFKRPKFYIYNREIVVPPLSNNYQLVGTAFDYLMRFYLKYLNPDAITRAWVAENAYFFEDDVPGAINLNNKAKDLLREAKNRYIEFLENGEITDELIRSTLHLAYMDISVRTLVLSEEIGDIEQTNEQDVLDLKNMYSLLTKRKRWLTAKKICVLNPTFGEASRLVGGADADLIIDDTLIDIKSTKKFIIKGEYINQLLGYYTLYRLGGIDNVKKNPEIKRLGIYYARFNKLCTFKISDIISEQDFIVHARWFVERAKDLINK